MTDVERDPNGRFLPGKAPKSPGRPSRRTEQAYLDATIGAVKLSDWRKIVKKAVEQALEGDSRAREWLGDYLLGRAPYNLTITHADAAVLRELLEALQMKSLSAGEVFNAMLAELADIEVITHERA